MASITTKQKHALKKFLQELEKHRGRHTELVTVYVPQGYDLNKIINQLSQEQGTASNIKSTSTRKNVQDALEKMIQHLKLFKRTPENGLAVFSGNVAEREGQSDVKVWSLEPPVPLKTKTYRCDKTFQLDILADMILIKEVYGLVVMDRRDATLALLKGKTIVPLVRTHSHVPGKTRAGGQCCMQDSLIQLHDGSIPRIEMVHNPNIVKSVMIKNNFSIRNSNITDKWNVKKNQVYKIVTKNPRLEVQTSKDHVFFVASQGGIFEKAAEELVVGDKLLMPEKIETNGKKIKLNSKKYYNAFVIIEEGREILKSKRLEKKLHQRQLAKKLEVTQTAISVIELGKRNTNRTLLKEICELLSINFQSFLKKYTKQSLYRDVKLPILLNEEFAQFLGYYAGDGSAEKDRITFFEQDKQVAMYYKKRFDTLFNLNSSYRFRESKNYHQIRFTSRPLVRLINKEFPEIRNAIDSEIPQKILQSNNTVTSAFLRGLFDAEGYVNVGRGCVGFSVNNKKLAQQIQMVLFRFSIISSLHEYDNRRNKYSNNPRFTVDITEKKSLNFFKEYIGFSGTNKLKKLEQMISKKTDKSNVRQVIVSGSKIRQMIEKAGQNLESFPKVNSFFRDERMMSKQAFKSSILTNIKDKKLYSQLLKIYDYPILPVKVSKIEKTNKTVEMVDISVKNQNFIANGLIVHNSAQRFERLRDGAAKDHYKKVADYIKDQFLAMKELKGIIIGGPSTTTSDFMEKDYLTGDIKKKILGIKDLSYTDEFGLQELLDKSHDLLAAEEVSTEKKIMGRFFELLATKPGKVAYGEAEVMDKLKNGIVDTVLLSEDCDDKTIDLFEAEAEKLGSELIIISTETREGVQLRDIGKIAALLRYEAS